MRMKPSILLAVLLCAGCGPLFSTPELDIDSMKPPVKLIAVSAEGDTIIQDAEGATRVYPASYYFSKAVRESFSIGDTIKPASHAPLVITNTVVVTNACPDQQPRWMLPAPMPHGWFNMTNSGPLILPYTIPTNWFDRTNNTINCQVGNVEAQ